MSTLDKKGIEGNLSGLELQVPDLLGDDTLPARDARYDQDIRKAQYRTFLKKASPVLEDVRMYNEGEKNPEDKIELGNVSDVCDTVRMQLNFWDSTSSPES